MADFSDFKHPLKFERFNKIALEAAEQSERARIPEILFSGKLKDFLDQYHTKEKGILTVAMEHLSARPSRSEANTAPRPLGASLNNEAQTDDESGNF